ncbi:transcriptional repressor [Lampropedia aestuarii]|nr:transcriptional repressor [Lampropedia aestuarii]MDH5856899.1 transcriptional repressor [Lampropedia aestuarii]
MPHAHAGHGHAAHDALNSPVHGERATRQRAAIREVMVKEARPMSPPEILDAAKKLVPRLGIATVYRNLKAMVEVGELSPVQLPGNRLFYELAHKADHHHHHFRCEDCERVFDIDGCDETFSALLPAGFTLHSHDLTLYGSCAECATKALARQAKALAKQAKAAKPQSPAA